MTTTQELIARLQSRTASMYLLEDVKLFHEAAAHIESLSAEVERQRVQLVNQSDWLVEWCKWEAEAKQLRALIKDIQ